MLLRDKLKSATREAHEALEARVALTHPELSFDDYVTYLQRLLPFYRALSDRLDASELGAPLMADCASRVAWLQDDLTNLGKESHAAKVPPEFLPRIGSTSELLGVSYVVEGSALGGRALYARLQSRWGIERHSGASFLFGYGADTGRRWQAFIAALNAVVLGEREESRCIAAARRMFTGLTDWFAYPRGWPAR